MDSTLMTVAMPSALGELLDTTSRAATSQAGSILASCFLLGWTIGGIGFGWIGDRLGRVRAMIGSVLLYAAFTGLSGFATTWPMLAACRFLTGLGIGGELVSIATFLAEVWPARSRAIAVGALITSYQAGVFLAGLVNLSVPTWRHAFWIGTLPALLVVFLRLAFKESDRWHEARDRQVTDGGHLSPMAILRAPAHRRDLMVGATIFGGLLVGYWASLSWIPTWIQSLPGVDAHGSARSIATMAQGLAAMVGCALAGWLADAIGRRGSLMLGYLGAFGMSAILFLTNPVFSSLVYLESAGLGFFTGIAQATSYVYLPELFPTRARATGTGFCLNAGRLVTAIAVLFVATAVGALGGYGPAALAFAGSYLVGIGGAWFGRETRRQPLLD
jgi:MFS family permease